MKNSLLKIMILSGIGLASQMALADTSQMNTQLIHMIDGLDAMLPLIDTAEKMQDKNSPMQFHFERWTDNQGVRHNGLRQDVLAMRAAMIAQINQSDLTPRSLPPLTQDYVQREK